MNLRAFPKPRFKTEGRRVARFVSHLTLGGSYLGRPFRLLPWQIKALDEIYIRYAKIRWRIEHDFRELKTDLGLDHFEGRSWQGWHRHVTLVTAAHLFLTLLRGDPKAAAPA